MKHAHHHLTGDSDFKNIFSYIEKYIPELRQETFIKSIENLIIRTQLDAIDETVKLCALNTKLTKKKILFDDSKEGDDAYFEMNVIDTESILSVAEKLKLEVG